MNISNDEFRNGYKPCAYLIKKYDGTVEADIISIINKWEQFYNNLVNVHQNSSVQKI